MPRRQCSSLRFFARSTKGSILSRVDEISEFFAGLKRVYHALLPRFVKDKKAMPGIQFVTDAKGRKVAVQIDLKKHRALWEDIEDVLVSCQFQKYLRM
jgi:hypothetical protein